MHPGKAHSRDWLPGAFVDPADFLPAVERLRVRAPSPVGRAVLVALGAFLAAFIAWAAIGKLDIVAVADGKLVPTGYLKIVQPAESGVVRELLVREGDRVRAQQVLARMDPVIAQADRRALDHELQTRRLAIRVIDAQLEERALVRQADDSPQLFAQAEARRAANAAAYRTALAQERAVLAKSRHDLAAANEVRTKLRAVLPHYREQEAAFDKLVRDGFAGRLLATEKRRERVEKEQDLRMQESVIAAARANIEQSERRSEQITADYRRSLQSERTEAVRVLERLSEEMTKLRHRGDQLELRAPQDGTVKDLATHTPGTVVSPGTILMTLVPHDERLRAEVWISNEDIGFVRVGQPVKLKLLAFPFQKYGMLEGTVARVSADATESPNPNTRSGALAGRDRAAGPLAFRTLVDLAAPGLESDGRRYVLGPGMQLAAEIHLGERTVLEYFLSPIRKAWHEAGRER